MKEDSEFPEYSEVLDEDSLKKYAVIGSILKMGEDNRLEVSFFPIKVREDSGGEGSITESDIENYVKEGLLDERSISGGRFELGKKSYELLNSLGKVWIELPQKLRELYVSKYNLSATVSSINARKIRNDENLIAKLFLSGDILYEILKENELQLNELKEIEEKGYVKSKKTDDVFLRNKGKLPHPIPCEICSEIMDKRETFNNRIEVWKSYPWSEKVEERSFERKDYEFRMRPEDLPHDSEWFKKHNIEILEQYNLSRGENFWKGEVEYLMEKNIRELPMKSTIPTFHDEKGSLTENMLEEIRKYYPDFNKESREMCPANLPKEKCEREWKKTDSLVFFAHSDIGNARFLLHAFNPGIYIKPHDKETKVSISVDDFKEVFETATQLDYEKPKKAKGRKWERKGTFQEEQEKSLLSSKIQKQDNIIVIDLSENSDEDLKRGKYISLDVLKTTYDKLTQDSIF